MAEQTHRPIQWSTLEEYQGDPDVTERLGGGDWNTKPAGFADKLEHLPIEELRLRRRSFLKLGGFAAVLATASGCQKPAETILPYVTAPEETIPGISSFYASTCRGCAAGCGILAETREARPIKLEGNPAHPVNKGALCARGQAQILDVYDPDRLRAPIATGRRDISWETAHGDIAAALGQAGSRAVLLTGTIHGPARTALLEKFLAAFPGMRHVTWDALSDEEAPAVRPRHRFEESKVTVLFGADPIAEGASPVEFNRGIGRSRTPRPAGKHGDQTTYEMARLYAFEPVMSLTGMNADYRFAVRPSELLDIMLSLATQLGVPGMPRVAASELDNRIKLLKTGETDNVALSEVIEQLAADLGQNRGRSIVCAGGMMARTRHARQLRAVAHAINRHLGNIGATIDYSRPSNQSKGSAKAMAELLADMNAGRVDVLLVEGTNPAYALPASARFADAVRRVKTKVSFSTHKDETAELCDYVLPGLHFLESWGDAEPYEGVLGIQQPTIAPLWDNRAFEQSLIDIARAGGSREFDAEDRAITWHEFLKMTWQEEIHARHGFAGAFQDFWFESLRTGVIELPARRNAAADAGTPPADLAGYAPAPATGDFEIATYVLPNTYDGRHANNPWLLELPDPVSRVCWDNFVAIAPSRARDMKVQDGRIVEVEVNGTVVRGPLRLFPGLHPNVLAVGTGWGRTSAGAVGWSGVANKPEGFNAFELGEVAEAGIVHSGLPASIRRTAESIRLADVQGHNYMRRKEWNLEEAPRQIVQATSLEKLNHDNKAPQPVYHIPFWKSGDPLPDAWRTKDFTYDRHKWVMTIDLNSCTGCSACMIACQAENNIPVVGKREVLVGREMHWIRIDRYFKGHPDNPEVAKQPMLCQHCDNAPCETVCPVLATVHSDDGINQQVYNRCVGTRYCANNCPYKVRRFNFYEYSKFRKGPHDELARGAESRVARTPLALALNPDITVRSKGVMEKCTFCQQRVREAKDEAKRLGRNIPDGALQTACQQTCPTQAITFGDAINPAHHVNAVRDQETGKRGYGVLTEFNVQPNVMYLAQIHNRESKWYDVDYETLKSGGHGGNHGDEQHGEEHSALPEPTSTKGVETS